MSKELTTLELLELTHDSVQCYCTCLSECPMKKKIRELRGNINE